MITLEQLAAKYPHYVFVSYTDPKIWYGPYRVSAQLESETLSFDHKYLARDDWNMVHTLLEFLAKRVIDKKIEALATRYIFNDGTHYSAQILPGLSQQT